MKMDKVKNWKPGEVGNWGNKEQKRDQQFQIEFLTKFLLP